jgi:hypothetical protein
MMSPFFEDEENRRDDEPKTDEVIPLQLFFQIDNGKNAEHDECDDFLNCLELGARELVRANSVGRHLETVFEERYEPADQNDLPQGNFPEFQMPVPGNRHENIRNSQQSDSLHSFLSG